MKNTTPTSTQHALAQLEDRLAAQQAAATCLADECAGKAFRIQQLEQELAQAIADRDEYKRLATETTEKAITEACEGINQIAAEITAARDNLRLAYQHNQNIQAIIPAAGDLRDVNDELDLQTGILKRGFDRIEAFIMGQTGDGPSDAAADAAVKETAELLAS